MQPIKSPIGKLVIHVILWIFIVWSAVPFFWTTLQSLKTERQANARTPLFIFTPTLENYATIWLDDIPQNPDLYWFILGLAAVFFVLVIAFRQHIPLRSDLTNVLILAALAAFIWTIPLWIETTEFYQYLLNTIIVCVLSVLISVSLASLSAYALARYAGILTVVILLTVLAFRALPRLGFILPYFWMGQRSGLYDTYILTVITLVAINQPFAVWMLRSFFQDIPTALEESAMIDGASRLGAFVRVIVPIAWPGIVATALFTLLLAYHEFLLIRILTQSKWTVAVGMSTYLGGVAVPGTIAEKSAAAVSAALPLIILILVYQRQLVKGLAAGAVKG